MVGRVEPNASAGMVETYQRVGRERMAGAVRILETTGGILILSFGDIALIPCLLLVTNAGGG